MQNELPSKRRSHSNSIGGVSNLLSIGCYLYVWLGVFFMVAVRSRWYSDGYGGAVAVARLDGDIVVAEFCPFGFSEGFASVFDKNFDVVLVALSADGDGTLVGARDGVF